MDGVNSLQEYYKEIKRYPLLEAEEEYNLTGLAKNGDKEAAKKIINANLRLVWALAKHYQGCGLPFEDLLQEGNTGLMKALTKYDRDKGFRFSTYAAWWIRQALSYAVSQSSRSIRLPINVINTINKARKASGVLVHTLGREPTDREIAEYLGMAYDKYLALKAYMNEPDSLDRTIDDEENASTSLGDMIEDTKFLQPEEAIDNEDNKIINDVLDTLTPRESLILKYRFGLLDGNVKTLEDVGKTLNLTKERIRQIEAKALRKLRHPYRANILKECLGE